MLRLLALLCLLLAGCGSLGDVQGSATLSGGQVTGSLTVPVGPANVSINPTGIRGELAVLVCLVDYADQPCPLSTEDAQEVISRLDAFVARNTSGLAAVRGRVARVTLGPTSDYTAEAYPEGGTDSRLQREARAATVGPERLRLYLLPATPVLATGGGFRDGSGGEAFISVWTHWQNLPIPHELGHMLGLPHGAGVMKQGSPWDNDWNGTW